MGKGKLVLWKLMVLMLRAGAIRLAKGVVREHLADAGHVAQIAIKDFPLALILVKTQSEMITQVAATLGIPIGQHSGNARVRGAQGYRIDVPRHIVGLVAQERHQVARGSVAHTQYLWVLCRIPEIVDKTSPKRCPLGPELYSTRIGVGPALRRDLRVGVPLFRPYRQSGLPLVQGGRGITERCSE